MPAAAMSAATKPACALCPVAICLAKPGSRRHCQTPADCMPARAKACCVVVASRPSKWAQAMALANTPVVAVLYHCA